MIRHIVLVKFEVEEDATVAHDLLSSLKGSSEDLESLFVGLDFVRAKNSYDLFLEMDFANRQAQEAFQNHPSHVAVRNQLKKLPKVSVKADCMIADQDE